MICKQSIPWAMAGARMVLGPALMVGECCGWSGFALASIIVTALLSDIFDGVLARRWHCDTAAVRLFDSMADTVFYLCVAAALWVAQPHLWIDDARLLGALLSLEALRFVLDFARFGKPASYHSYLAKSWGLVMALGVIVTFATTHANRLLPVALWLGIATDLEGLAMSLILPVWRRDVKTLAAAWRIRRELLPPKSKAPARLVSVTLPGLLILALGTIQAHGLEHNQAVYAGGSAAIAIDSLGTFDASTSPTTLLLHFTNPGGASAQVAIDYANIKTAQPSRQPSHHLGVAPAIAVGLLAARQHRYFLTLTWTDASGVAQATVLEVSISDQEPLLAVIRARMSRLCPTPASACTLRQPPRACATNAPAECSAGRPATGQLGR